MTVTGFNVEAAAYLMKIAPDNCIYLSQSASIRLPFQLLDRLMILKPRVKLNKDFDNMVSFMYNSRVLLSIADTDFYEIHEEVKKAYQAAVKVMKNKDQTQGRSSQCNTLQFIVVEGMPIVWKFISSSTLLISSHFEIPHAVILIPG